MTKEKLSQVKEISKKIWNFHKNLSKYEKHTITPYPGATVTFEVSVDVNYGDLDWDVRSTELKLSKELSKFVDSFDMSFNLYRFESQPSRYIPVLDELAVTYQILMVDIEDALRQHFEETGNDLDPEYFDNVTHFNNFNDFWRDVQTYYELGTVKLPKNQAQIKLTREYNAIVTKGSSVVRVGCQQIEFAVIEQLVASYKTLNGKK